MKTEALQYEETDTVNLSRLVCKKSSSIWYSVTLWKATGQDVILSLYMGKVEQYRLPNTTIPFKEIPKKLSGKQMKLLFLTLGARRIK